MHSFIIYTKRSFKSLLFIFLILAMPAIALGYDYIGGISKKPVIGLYFQCNNTEAFNDIYSETMDFEVYENKDNMLSDISLGIIDSGYIFDEKFDRAAEELNFKNSIDCVSSKSSVMQPVANEFIYKAILNKYSVNIADKFFKSKNIDINSGKYYNEFLTGKQVFNIDIEYAASGNNEKENKFILTNIFAVFVFIGGIIASINIVGDRKKGIYKHNYIYVLSYVFWLMLSVFLAANICGEFNMAMALIYILYTVAVSLFAYITAFIGSREIICGILPVIAVLAFVLSGSIVDISDINSLYGCICMLLPPIYFVNSDLTGLIIYTVILSGIAYGLKKRSFV